jgi:hypothetical protein
MPIVGKSRPWSRTSSHDSFCLMVSHWEPSDPQTVGPMPGESEGPTTAAPGAVGEDERRAAVGRVGEVGELLDADDQDEPSALPPRTMSLASEMPWQ